MRILLALKSIKADWIFVVTGTGFALLILAVSYLPLGRHPWIPWTIFTILWSISWGWAFVRSWNREHAEVERLQKLLLREYVVQVVALHKPNVVWNLANERWIMSQMNGDEVLIRRAIETVKSHPNPYPGMI